MIHSLSQSRKLCKRFSAGNPVVFSEANFKLKKIEVTFFDAEAESLPLPLAYRLNYSD